MLTFLECVLTGHDDIVSTLNEAMMALPTEESEASHR